MSEHPKLYVNKPKKAQLKQSKGIMEAQSTSTAAAPAASSTSTGSGNGGGGAPKPPESFLRRYKFFLPLILTVNIAVGAYLFMRTKKKEISVEEKSIDAAPTTTPSTSGAIPTTTVVTESLPSAQVTKTRESIPEEQQRELFKWMLEEKRKIKTKDPLEKKRIDEEKAILKQFIRDISIPSF